MRQAVVIIHGIGEQRPLATLRGFVGGITDGVVRNKPDRLSESFELRRFSLAETRSMPRTDVYEFYWAHRLKQASWSVSLRWMRKLMLRKTSSVPDALRPVHRVLWLSSIVVLSAAVWAAVRFANVGGWPALLTSVLPVVAFAAQVLFGRMVLRYIGDAAQYLTPDPENIDVRSSIRSDGVRLLRRLHESRNYSRIVVVGHSLGSVIGYDVLRYAWDEMRKPSFSKICSQPEATDFRASIDAVNNPPEGVSRARAVELFQQAQHRLWREQREAGTPWLVTDFVTLGSPLAHADLLLEDPLIPLEQRKAERELPTCPPATNDDEIHYGENHDVDDGAGRRRWYFRIPNHGAVFCSTRWVNLYFPYRRLVLGDVVGGPMAEVFGRGIRDVRVRPAKHGFRSKTLACHKLYWDKGPIESAESNGKKPGSAPSLKDSCSALRSALQLESKRSKLPWPLP